MEASKPLREEQRTASHLHMASVYGLFFLKCVSPAGWEKSSKICEFSNCTPRALRQRAKFHFFSFLFLSVFSSTGDWTTGDKSVTHSAVHSFHSFHRQLWQSQCIFCIALALISKLLRADLIHVFGYMVRVYIFWSFLIDRAILGRSHMIPKWCWRHGIIDLITGLQKFILQLTSVFS